MSLDNSQQEGQMNPTQNSSTESSLTSPNVLPNVPQGLDPTAYVLTRAIAMQEGGGKILSQDAPGNSGEIGPYQYEPSTWNARASKFLGPGAPSIEDAPVDQQNEVTYKWVNEKLNTLNPKTGQNYTPAEVASMHNAGEGAPDAWQGNESTNSSGVHYDTKGYVENVQKYAQQIWGEGGGGNDASSGGAGYGYVSPPTTKQNIIQPPSPTNLGTPGSNDPTLGDQVGATGILKNAVDIGGSLLPILPDLINDIQGKNDKSALQQIGDAGMSALWFLPFGDIAEGAGLGLKALGVGADLAKAGGVLGTGLGTGYASDVASNLGQGKTDASVLTPGMGTLVGGGLSAAGLAGGALYNKFLGQQNAVDKVQQIWEDAAGSTKSGITNMSKTAAKGLDANPEFLSNAGILPETSEVNGRIVFNTGEDSVAQKTINDRISALSELRDASLDKGPNTSFTSDVGNGPMTQGTPPVVNFEELRQQMLTQAAQDFSGTAKQTAEKQINAEMDAILADPKYAINPNGEMTATQTSQLKTYLQGRASLDRPTQGLSAKIFDTMQGEAKGAVENAAEASGNPNVRAVNKMIQQHYDALKFLNKINGQTIKGGRLGTYVKGGVGAAVGGTLGTMFGGGPIGGAIGTLAGYKGGEVVSNLMQKLAAGGPLTAATFGRMAKEEPQVVQHLLQYVGKTGEDAGAIAPMVKPVPVSAGERVIQGLSKTPGSRVYRGMSRPNYIFGGGAKP